jgi:S-adenosylmethionine hydrolase
MGSEGLTCEQENPRVRGEVSIMNPFGSIVSSHKSTTSSNSYSSSIAEQVHNTSRKLVNPFIELFLIVNPVHRRKSLSICSSS